MAAGEGSRGGEEKNEKGGPLLSNGLSALLALLSTGNHVALIAPWGGACLLTYCGDPGVITCQRENARKGKPGLGALPLGKTTEPMKQTGV